MTQIKPWAVEMTERVCGGAPFKIGDRVMHPKHGLVEITAGQYWGTHGISNFWYWTNVLNDGRLGKRNYHGYGWSIK